MYYKWCNWRRIREKKPQTLMEMHQEKLKEEKNKKRKHQKSSAERVMMKKRNMKSWKGHWMQRRPVFFTSRRSCRWMRGSGLKTAYMKLGNPLKRKWRPTGWNGRGQMTPWPPSTDSSNSSLTMIQDRLCWYILLDSCCWLSTEKSISIHIKVRKQGDCLTLIKHPEVS